MNLDELRTVQAKERQKDGLQHLRESFYADVGEYLAELKAERDRVAAGTDEPFADPEVQHLTDEIETVEGVVEAIYERRMGKLVKRASLAAAGMPADRDGLTAEEQDLFDELVETIQENKASVLDVLSGDQRRSEAERAGMVPGTESTEADRAAGRDAESGASGALGEGAAPSAAAESGEEAGAAAAGDGDSADDGSAGDDKADLPADDDGSVDENAGEERAGEDPTGDGDGPTEDVGRTTVRITADVGDILGVDEREYHLEAEDVVTLPTANAEPLIDRDAAEPVE